MVAAPKDKVWARLMDIPAAARCVPGVASVRPNGKDRYQGTLAVQIGPVRLVLDGDFAIVARDEAAGTASIRADAKDSRVGGAIRATLDLSLAGESRHYEETRLLDVSCGGCERRFLAIQVEAKIEALRIVDVAEAAAQLARARSLSDLFAQGDLDLPDAA